MKNFIIIVLVIIVAWVIRNNSFSLNTSNKMEVPSPSFLDMKQPLSKDTINCEFKTISIFTYENLKKNYSDENRKIYLRKSDKNDHLNLITFTGISTGNPKIKGNQGEYELSMIKNDKETIVLLEKNLMGDIFTYTIFKEDRVATWYKAYKIINIPFTMLSMGYCY